MDAPSNAAAASPKAHEQAVYDALVDAINRLHSDDELDLMDALHALDAALIEAERQDMHVGRSRAMLDVMSTRVLVVLNKRALGRAGEPAAEPALLVPALSTLARLYRKLLTADCILWTRCPALVKRLGQISDAQLADEEVAAALAQLLFDVVDDHKSQYWYVGRAAGRR